MGLYFNDIKNHKYSKIVILGLPIFIGAVLGGIILGILSLEKQEIKLDEFALGKGTSTKFSEIGGFQIHCQDLTDLEKCEQGYFQSNMKNVILWLGNSQIHSINQMQLDDETAAPILHRHFKNLNYYFLTFSQPNANLQEHYLLFEYLLDSFPIKILVLPVVFDDMRETGIRPSLEMAFSNAKLTERLKKTKIGKELLANFGEKDSAGNDMTAIADTLQESMEKQLNDKLAEHSVIWAKRSEIRGRIFLFLYKLRNFVFNINPSTIRKIIQGRYLKNIDAFKAIIDVAISNNIKVLVYIVPLRYDVPIPYKIDQYQMFKQDIKLLSEKDGVRFINLEKIISNKLWGTKESTTLGGGLEYDYMHFKGEGHRMLAKSLIKELSTLLNKGNSQ